DDRDREHLNDARERPIVGGGRDHAEDADQSGVIDAPCIYGAYAQVDRHGGDGHPPAVVARPGNDPVLGQEIRHVLPLSACRPRPDSRGRAARLISINASPAASRTADELFYLRAGRLWARLSVPQKRYGRGRPSRAAGLGGRRTAHHLRLNQKNPAPSTTPIRPAIELSF